MRRVAPRPPPKREVRQFGNGGIQFDNRSKPDDPAIARIVERARDRWLIRFGNHVVYRGARQCDHLRAMTTHTIVTAPPKAEKSKAILRVAFVRHFLKLNFD